MQRIIIVIALLACCGSMLASPVWLGTKFIDGQQQQQQQQVMQSQLRFISSQPAIRMVPRVVHHQRSFYMPRQMVTRLRRVSNIRSFPPAPVAIREALRLPVESGRPVASLEGSSNPIAPFESSAGIAPPTTEISVASEPATTPITEAPAARSEALVTGSEPTAVASTPSSEAGDSNDNTRSAIDVSDEDRWRDKPVVNYKDIVN